MRCYKLKRNDKFQIGDITVEGHCIRLVTNKGNFCFGLNSLFYCNYIFPDKKTEHIIGFRKSSK